MTLHTREDHTLTTDHVFVRRAGATVQVGDALPPLSYEVTPTLIVAGAFASRDYEPVHHDPALAKERGSEDIFLNILTTNGMVLRQITDWAGPDATVLKADIGLGVPAYAGDRLDLDAEVVKVVHEDGTTTITVKTVGTVSIGNHVTAGVTITLPTEATGQPVGAAGGSDT